MFVWAVAAPVVRVGTSWTQLIVVALIGVIGLFIAAAIGAWLQARGTRKQALELHRVQREQDALLRLLDLLSIIDMAVLRSTVPPAELEAALDGREDASHATGLKHQSLR